MRYALSFAAGAIFALGLAISGMTQPSKVQGFLDVFGNWDPSLAFVMGAAVITNFVLFRFVLKRENPLFAGRFDLPGRRDIDPRLLFGSALFGIGWGLVGYCPGPAITAMGTFDGNVALFLAAMFGGMFVHSRTTRQ